MRNLLIFTFFLPAILACSDYKYEDTLIECAYKNGIDIRGMVRKNEQFLIERGVLKDGSGKDYYTYCKSITRSIPKDMAFDLDFGSSFPGSLPVDCHTEQFDSLDTRRANRKIIRLQKMLQAHIEEGITDISLLAAQLITVLTPRDLEHDYYKLMLCVNLSLGFNPGLERQLPTMNDRKEPQVIDRRNMIMVCIDASNQITVNGAPTDITVLRSVIKDFFDTCSEGEEYPEKHVKDIPLLGVMRTNKTAVVALKNDKGTSYRYYIQVSNELMQAVRELRDELSIERFGKIFDNCSAEEQAAVAEVYPMAISEME